MIAQQWTCHEFAGVAEGRVYTSMYRDLRTNLPREVMSFLDFPFLPSAMGGRSHDARRFCSHSEVGPADLSEMPLQSSTQSSSSSPSSSPPVSLF